MDITIILGVGMFTATVLFLVMVILFARSRLVSTGDVTIEINDDPDKAIVVPAGGKLLGTLASKGIFLASACGGGGTCAQCRCRVTDGGGSILSTEEGHFTRGEISDDWRLSCQVAVKQDMKIQIPEDAIGVQRWECEVTSNPNVATFIKELNLKLPEGADVAFRAGGYVQLEIPPYEMQYREIDVEDEYHEDWDRFQRLGQFLQGGRDHHPRLLNGQLSGREGHPQVQHPGGLTTSGHGRAGGQDVVLRIQPQAG